MGQLVVKPNLLRGSTTRYERFNPGEYTISELVEKTLKTPLTLSYVDVYINGHKVDQKLWSILRPKDVHLVIANRPHGSGDDDKAVFRVVAIVALTVFTGGIAAGGIAALGIAGGTAAAYGAAAVITIAGTLAIGAIFPPPAIGNLGSSGANNPAESKTLTIAGQRNTLSPMAPIPRVYGQHRVYPMLGAVPHIQTKGKRTQSIFMLFDFGYGPLTIRDMRIGDTHISQFKGVEVYTHTELKDGSQLKLFSKTFSTEDLSIAMNPYESYVRETADDTDAVQIDLTFPRGCAYYDEVGNRKTQEVVFRVEYRVVGNITWIPFSNGTSYSFSRDRIKVSEVAHEGQSPWGFGWGPPDSPLPPAFPTTEVQLVGSPFEIIGDYDRSGITGGRPPTVGFPRGSTVIRVIANRDTPAGSSFIINGFPYTVTADAPAGEVDLTITPPLRDDLITNFEQIVFPANNDGVPTYQAVAYAYYGYITHRPVRYFSVEDETAEPFTVQMTINFGSRAKYEIRVTRETDENYEGAGVDRRRFVDESVWTALRSIKNQAPVKFDKPHTVVEMKITATDQLNSVVERFSAIASSQLQVYNGTSFSRQETRNPAWIAYDVLTGNANPNPVPASKVDIDKFYEWAQWCEEIASNANEPRFLCDVVIDYSSTVFDILRSVMSAGRASPTVRDGKYSVIFDKEPTVPVQLITPHNSWGFTGERFYGEEPHQVNVSFVDPDSGWQVREKVVYNDGYDSSNAMNQQNISLFGCTRHTQAYRDGRYHLAQAILRQETFTVTMDIENIVCERGDYVLVQHDVPRVGGMPARIKAINGDQITATEPFELDFANNTYHIRIREDDNNLVSYPIDSQVDPFTIVVTGLQSAKVGDLFVYGITDLVTDEYLVKSIKPVSDLTATLELNLLARAVYSAETDPIPPYSAVISPDMNVNPPLVVNPVAIEEVIFIERLPLINIILRWEDGDSQITEQYEIYELRGDEWRLLDTVDDKMFFAYKGQPGADANGYDVVGREHAYKIIAVSASGNKVDLEKAEVVRITPQGDTTIPPKVRGINLDLSNQTAQLSWLPPFIPDLDGYIIKFSPNNVDPSWDSATLLTTVPWDINTIKVNTRIGSYLIKARDTSGNVSVDAAIVLSQISDIHGINFIESLKEDPDWPGVMENLERDGTTLRTIEVQRDPAFPDTGVQEYAQEGWYHFKQLIDLGTIQECRLTAKILAHVERSVPFAVGEEALEWTALMEVRTAEKFTVMADWLILADIDPIGGIDDKEFGPWRAFDVADLTTRLLSFRVKVAAIAALRVVLESAEVVVDMPDRIMSDRNVSSGVGGLLVQFDKPYYSPPAISITNHEWEDGSYYRITNITAASFTIEFFNRQDQSIDVIFDWWAKGHGVQHQAILPPEPVP